MELVEGAPLGEHFNSLKEKGTRFSEERIWHIFIQVHLIHQFLIVFFFSPCQHLVSFFFTHLFHSFLCSFVLVCSLVHSLSCFGNFLSLLRACFLPTGRSLSLSLVCSFVHSFAPLRAWSRLAYSLIHSFVCSINLLTSILVI